MDENRDFYLGELTMPEFIRVYGPALILIFILLAVIYSNSFQGSWIFDDKPNILENEHVHVESLDFQSIKNSIHGLNGGINRPLAFLSFGINYFFGKTNTFGYHLVNLAIHCLTACFLFLLILKTLQLPMLRQAYSGKAYSIALLATVFWAINPLQVTAVTYIVQRMASMAGLFYVMSMYFYLLSRTSEDIRKQAALFAAAACCTLLGLASKQNAAMIPVSIFIYDLFLIQGVNRLTLLKNLIIAAALLFIFLVIGAVYTDYSTILSGYSDRPFTLGERLLTEPRVLFFYVSQLLYPVDSRLTLVHEVHVSTGLFSPATTFLSIAGIITGVGFALFRSRKYPLLCFSIMFFLVNHLIEATFIPLELIYEHRNYIPSFFFFVPAAVLIVRVMSYFSYRKFLQYAVAILLIVVWVGQGHTVYMRNQRFADPVSLWADNAEKAPGLSRVYSNLGNLYFEENKYTRAYENYLKAKKADYFHSPENRGMLHHNLGVYYFHVERDFDKALHHLNLARRMYSGNWRAWYYSALSEIGRGNFFKAQDFAAKAYKWWPEKEPLQYVRSLSLLKQGNYDKCIEIAQESLRKGLEPGRFYKLIGIACNYTLKLDMAEKFLSIAYDKLSPDPDLILAMVDTYQKKKDLKAMNRIIRELICIKGEKTWSEYLGKSAEENIFNAYKIIPSNLLPVIREGMRSLTP